MSRFIDVDNMRIILETFATLVSREPRSVQESVYEQDVKKVVFDTMVRMAQDPAFADLSLGEMNRVVVETTLEYYRLLSSEARAPDPDVEPRPPNPPRRTPILASNEAEFAKEEGSRPKVEVPPMPPPGSSSEVAIRKGISIDGGDRNTGSMPSRYSFTAHLLEPLRSVKQVRVAAVVIPLQDHTVNCSHLLLVVDELSGPFMHSSNDATKRAFAKLIPSRTYEGVQTTLTTDDVLQTGRTYAVLEPVPDIASVFSPPLSSLSQLSIRLLRPDGSYVSDAHDAHLVVKVTEAHDANWMITTKSRWRRQEFARGDIVVMSGCRSGNDAMDRHINRSAGHVVIESGGAEVAVADEGCNTVIIRSPGIINADGAFVVDEEATRAFSDDSGLGEVTMLDPANLMNASLQMSITMEATCSQASMST